MRLFFFFFVLFFSLFFCTAILDFLNLHYTPFQPRSENFRVLYLPKTSKWALDNLKVVLYFNLKVSIFVSGTDFLALSSTSHKLMFEKLHLQSNNQTQSWEKQSFPYFELKLTQTHAWENEVTQTLNSNSQKPKREKIYSFELWTQTQQDSRVRKLHFSLFELILTRSHEWENVFFSWFELILTKSHA